MTLPSGSGQTDQSKSVSIVAASAPPTYTFDVYVDGGGSAIGTDPDPNVTPPPDNRVARIPAGRFTFANVRLCPMDGTTVTVNIWVYDDVRALWVKLAPALPVSAGGSGLSSAGSNPAGAKVFVQVTANTGVTKFVWFFT